MKGIILKVISGGLADKLLLPCKREESRMTRYKSLNNERIYSPSLAGRQEFEKEFSGCDIFKELLRHF